MYENKSRLISQEIFLLRDSNSSFVNKLSECLYFERAKQSSGVLRGKNSSDLQKFKNDIAKISETFDDANQNYVRCFNPNSSLIPEAFSRDYVHRQINDMNITEALNVSKDGFTRKYSRRTFYTLYQLLMSGSNHEEDEIIRLLSKLNEKVEEGGKMGRRKVFLKREAFCELERMRREKMHSFVVRVQAHYRMMKAKFYFRNTQVLARSLQILFRDRHKKSPALAVAIIQAYLRRALISGERGNSDEDYSPRKFSCCSMYFSR